MFVPRQKAYILFSFRTGITASAEAHIGIKGSRMTGRQKMPYEDLDSDLQNKQKGSPVCFSSSTQAKRPADQSISDSGEEDSQADESMTRRKRLLHTTPSFIRSQKDG